MIIDRKIEKYIIFYEEDIKSALKKIDANDMRVIFVLNEAGILKGIVTDGDFRRWILAQDSVDLTKSVGNVCNTNFFYTRIGESPDKIQSFFSKRIDYVPLVDKKMRLVAVATERKPVLAIGKHILGSLHPVFIIAEIGNNHNGDVELAKHLVDAAASAGADCVKFQMRNMSTLYQNEGRGDTSGEDLGSQYVLDLLDRFQLSDEELLNVFNYCREKNITPLCTPWDKQSVDILDQYGLDAFKVASADFTNHELLTHIASKGKPMICSTGMSTEQEVLAGIELLQRQGAQFILLHCNSTYPAPFKDINLHYLRRLQELSDFPVGYSGHERGVQVPIGAVAMGAKVIEKHLTLDRSMEGNDHKVSLLPDEFRQMIDGIRNVEQALGTEDRRTISQGELINRETLAKSLVTASGIKSGQVITSDMVEVKSPGRGLPPYRKNELIGRVANRDMQKGDFFYPEDLESDVVQPRDFEFIHQFGVPVRYHDIQEIAETCRMDLLEIHLSYKDLDEDIDKYFSKPLSHRFVVHSPELFAGDHILNLCSKDNDYRRHSIQLLQRVVDVTRYLKKFFPQTEKPLIVTNVGGFSADHFVDARTRQELYGLLLESLGDVDQNGIEIIPQTMPPYPWHFGGQRYHNLFVDINEIVAFCSQNNYRVCLDISHSKLACNYLKVSFMEFLNKIATYTAHMHIADAAGLDGEGLQIGDGEMDFSLIMKSIASLMPSVSFIPEIWQGHKNKGQGFWVALDRLEKATTSL